jgi:hypothetical protein
MGRVDPGTARVTAVTPLEELDTAVTTLAVGAGGVWVGGALHLSRCPGWWWTESTHPAAASSGSSPWPGPPRGCWWPTRIRCGLPPWGAAGCCGSTLPDVTNPTKEARLPPS